MPHRASIIEPLEFRVVMSAAAEPLAPPSVLGATHLGAERIDLTWHDNAADESGFEILRRLFDSPDSELIAVGRAGADAEMFSDGADLEPDRRYEYRIRAVRTDKDSTIVEAGPFSDPIIVDTVVDYPVVVFSGSADFLFENPDSIYANTIRLTRDVSGQLGGAFTLDGLDVAAPGREFGKPAGFHTQFDFRVPKASSDHGEGFAFVIQRDSPATLGEGGDGLGYRGMNRSLAVKFDLSGAASRVGVYADGAMDDRGDSVGFDIADGAAYRVQIFYDDDAHTLKLGIQGFDSEGEVDPQKAFERTFDSIAASEVGGAAGVDIPAIVGGRIAHVGFTGATNDRTAEQKIVDWMFNDARPALPHGDPSPGADLYVRGGNWSMDFRNFLASQFGQGSNTGFNVSRFGPNSPIIPFSNLDTIAVDFAYNVPPSFAAGSVTIISAAGRTYAVASVAPDPLDRTVALVKLGAPIANDRVSIHFAGLTDVDGNPLAIQLNVLPGDVNLSGGTVNASDVVITRNRLGHSTASPGQGASAYSIFNDLNGDGVINATDLVIARNNIGRRLPEAPAALFVVPRPAPLAHAETAWKDEDLD